VHQKNTPHRPPPPSFALDASLKKEIQLFTEKFLQSSEIKRGKAIVTMLNNFSPDKDTLIAGLLLKCAELEKPPLEEIKKQFGSSVCQIITGLHKLTILTGIALHKSENHTDVMRKMFLALAKDIRVVLIKLVDRLYTLENFNLFAPEKQEQYAKEVFDLYAPIAARLGIYRLKEGLENIAFKFLFPKDHKRLMSELKKLTISQKGILKKGENALKKILKNVGVQGEVQGRIKDPYSIFQKLRKKETSKIEDINDLFAFRVVVKNVSDCYTVLGQVHQTWNVLSSRFKDYIAVPKPNGYKSLHTTIRGFFDRKYSSYPVEIQIRTFAMHEKAEFGSAVHWNYKEKGDTSKGLHNWFGELAKTSKNLQDADNFLIFAKDFLGEMVFALTEKGDVKTLPHGATPIDFAYAIHSEIGNHCQGAVINGRIVPLNYKIQNGDVIKIITQKNVSPRESWLSLAVSSSSRHQDISRLCSRKNFDISR